MKLFSIVIKNNTKLVQGLMIGFVAGRGKNERIYHGKDYDIKPVHLQSSIIELLGLGGQYTHYIIQESLVKPVSDLVKSLEEDCGISLESVEEIDHLEFHFELKIYSKEIGERVLEIFRNKEDDITIAGFEPEEIVREDAEGPELYSPEHDYELTGEGDAQGHVQSLLSFYYRLKEIEQVHQSEITLKIKE